MFKKIVLDNFMSFDHIEFDLSGTGKEGTPLPYAVIYGENGAGKSNIVSSFLFLKDTLHTMVVRRAMDEAGIGATDNIRDIIRVGTRENATVGALVGSRINLDSCAESYRMIDGGPMSVSYSFSLNGRDGCYKLSFDQGGGLISEEMTYRANKRAVALFSIRNGGSGPVFDGSKITYNRKYRKDLSERVDRFWGKNTFLSILRDQMDRNNPGYMSEAIYPALMDIMGFFFSFSVSFRGKTKDARYQPFEILDLSGGVIPAHKEKDLMRIEKGLSSFFKRTFSDIKGVYYRLDGRDAILEYTLIFKKMICGKIRDVEASSESTGTIGLLENFQSFLSCCMGNTIVIDETDNGVHDLMMDNVFREMLDANKGQIIMTAHDTLFLEHISPKSTFILQIDGAGRKRMVRVSDLERTQKNHNNRQRYIRGLFGGVPVLSEIDMGDIAGEMGSGE
ncbi:MAG: AAA family ATPase [Candidatus Methanoplasma sp.]|nr:AAA family ATPase [Candidatus Methanoplasma sp.]